MRLDDQWVLNPSNYVVRQKGHENVMFSDLFGIPGVIRTRGVSLSRTRFSSGQETWTMSGKARFFWKYRETLAMFTMLTLSTLK